MLYQSIRETVNSKSFLVPYTEALKSFIKDKNKDYYVSLYQYTDEHKKTVDQTGSVRGIKDTTTDRIYIDFDSKENIELARQDALVVADRLVNNMGIDPDNIQAYFTGNKGYAIEFKINKRVNSDQFKAIVFDIAGDLKTFDSTVSDPNRIIRIPNTKHQATGLYKIPLKLYELDELSVDQVKELAKSPREEFTDLTPIDLPEDYYKVIKKETKVTVTSDYKLDMTKKPSQWRNCKWSLLQGNFKSGERHNALLVIAATARALGYDKEQTYYLCKSALKKQSAITGSEEFPKEELWTNIIEESVFKDGWEGGQYTCQKPGWLQLYCKSLGEHSCKEGDDEKIVPSRICDITDSFKNFVLHIDENTIKTGIKSLDEKLPLTIGMNLGVVGAPSSGKTALALEILKNTSKAGVVSVFASLDMHRNRLFEKLLYKVSGGKSREEVYELFKSNKENELIQKIKEDYGNVYFYDRSSPTVTDIRRYIEEINSTSPNKVKLVMLDYFERVTSDKSEDTAASKDVAGKLQDLINDYNICLVTLVQPNKMSLSGGPDTPILNYTAIKGSSFLFQSFRSIVSIWRPFLNPKTKDIDKYLQMAILKNDLGELDTFDYGFEGKTGKIFELEEEQYYELQRLLKEKEDAKAGKEDGGWD